MELVQLDCSHVTKETLLVLRSESTVLNLEEEANMIMYLFPKVDPSLFVVLANWVNYESLDHCDTKAFDSNTQVLQWCRLHVLAQRYHLKELGKECLERYKSCRKPHWQGWMPLPQEIQFIYSGVAPNEHTIGLKNVVVEHMTAQIYSRNRPGEMSDLAGLMIQNKDFAVDILRALRVHITGQEGFVQKVCQLENCWIHLEPDPILHQEDAPSLSPTPVATDSGDDLAKRIPDKEEMDAMYEAEAEEAWKEADLVKLNAGKGETGDLYDS
ncbi:hypothetical protein B0J14DRAFT_106446 [Halenospora varia]|nr:hypothetical protein B0J14DRAFT_106446 [Halenospora varia]